MAGERQFQTIGLPAFILPGAAVRYILHMDPRAATVPLSALLAVFVLLVSGSVLLIPVAYVVTWLGIGDAGAYVVLGSAPVLSAGTFLMSLGHFRRSPATVATRSVLLLVFPMAWSILFGVLAVGAALLQIAWLAPTAGMLLVVSLLWWPLFVIAGEIRLGKARRSGICCPACGYCLVGLPTPRCPECGLEAPPA